MPQSQGTWYTTGKNVRTDQKWPGGWSPKLRLTLWFSLSWSHLSASLGLSEIVLQSLAPSCSSGSKGSSTKRDAVRSNLCHFLSLFQAPLITLFYLFSKGEVAPYKESAFPSSSCPGFRAEKLEAWPYLLQFESQRFSTWRFDWRWSLNGPAPVPDRSRRWDTGANTVPQEGWVGIDMECEEPACDAHLYLFHLLSLPRFWHYSCSLKWAGEVCFEDMNGFSPSFLQQEATMMATMCPAHSFCPLLFMCTRDAE